MYSLLNRSNRCCYKWATNNNNINNVIKPTSSGISISTTSSFSFVNSFQRSYSSKSKKLKEKINNNNDDDDDIESTNTSSKSKKSSKASGTGSSQLESTMAEIEKTFGKGTLMKLGTSFATQKVDVISSGSLGLDVALGIGGLPKGRIIEIFGPESSGKTTLALHVIAQAQKAGGNCTFIDAEHALNPSWAQKLGVNLDELFISQPDSGEQALEIVDSLLRSKTMQVIVVDSVAALVPRVELEGEMGDSHVGVQARLMSQALRKLSPNLKESNCILIFINQIRMKIGVMFGNPETTTGGNALKFFSSIRLDIRKIGAVKKGEEAIASQVRVKVAKNKLAPPFREAVFDIDFVSGINKTGEIIDMAVTEGIIEKGGSWYSYNQQQLAQGREKTKQYLEDNQELLNEIESKLRQRLVKSVVPTSKLNDNNEDYKDEYDHDVDGDSDNTSTKKVVEE
ncbi:recombinase A [Heterostelium album PN500]|uniref:Recombinase A n=1 Tax=Heterostelium pallidum (strain ATCC 26659 / Pp 5 / PN500) TaxID=670386 RepID=D3B236_HETP5|nr:recombinase A [Heterostelium album PN500]EFA84411.1 recombinase A [Heterostelium album PN500]|eukprot:XP_020436525.1 recombinase A [Heterostelium album PN500]